MLLICCFYNSAITIHHGEIECNQILVSGYFIYRKESFQFNTMSEFLPNMDLYKIMNKKDK